jgi:hypothetical protein
LSISHAFRAFATRRSVDSASATPARKTNVGAQMCVIQRVKNSPPGSAIVAAPGTSPSPRRGGAVECHRRVVDDHEDHDEARIQSIAAIRVVFAVTPAPPARQPSSQREADRVAIE